MRATSAAAIFLAVIGCARATPCETYCEDMNDGCEYRTDCEVCETSDVVAACDDCFSCLSRRDSCPGFGEEPACKLDCDLCLTQ
jgi:hypothetical protein